MAIKNVYIADDDIDDIEFFAEALYQVDKTAVLTNGKNGVELLKKLLYPEPPTPDIIFLDINMPLMNGLECLKEIKQHLHLKHIPIVMYTTSALTSTIELAYRLGANLLVEKPAEFDKLKNILSSILGIDFTAQSQPDKSQFVYKAS